MHFSNSGTLLVAVIAFVTIAGVPSATAVSVSDVQNNALGLRDSINHISGASIEGRSAKKSSKKGSKSASKNNNGTASNETTSEDEDEDEPSGVGKLEYGGLGLLSLVTVGVLML